LRKDRIARSGDPAERRLVGGAAAGRDPCHGEMATWRRDTTHVALDTISPSEARKICRSADAPTMRAAYVDDRWGACPPHRETDRASRPRAVPLLSSHPARPSLRVSSMGLFFRLSCWATSGLVLEGVVPCDLVLPTLSGGKYPALGTRHRETRQVRDACAHGDLLLRVGGQGLLSRSLRGTVRIERRLLPLHAHRRGHQLPHLLLRVPPVELDRGA
jgi:hypothetical protein